MKTALMDGDKQIEKLWDEQRAVTMELAHAFFNQKVRLLKAAIKELPTTDVSAAKLLKHLKENNYTAAVSDLPGGRKELLKHLKENNYSTHSLPAGPHAALVTERWKQWKRIGWGNGWSSSTR